MGIVILSLVLGIICIIIDYVFHFSWCKRNKEYIKEWGRPKYSILDGTPFGLFGLIFIFVPIILIPIVKLGIHAEERNFSVKYEVIKTTITNSDDVRDATYTNNIIEINEEILKSRKYSKSKWTGVFYSKKIGEYELITYESN